MEWKRRQPQGMYSITPAELRRDAITNYQECTTKIPSAMCGRPVSTTLPRSNSCQISMAEYSSSAGPTLVPLTESCTTPRVLCFFVANLTSYTPFAGMVSVMVAKSPTLVESSVVPEPSVNPVHAKTRYVGPELTLALNTAVDSTSYCIGP